MERFLLGLIFLVSICAYSQKGDTAQFVCVSLSHYIVFTAFDDSIQCIARFSDGHKEDLAFVFDLPKKKKEIVNPDVIANYEFRMLNYFYQRGYELLAVVPQLSSRQFYFKHK